LNLISWVASWCEITFCIQFLFNFIFFSFVCLDLLGRLNNDTYVIWKGFFFFFLQCFSFSYHTFCGMQNRSVLNTAFSTDLFCPVLSVTVRLYPLTPMILNFHVKPVLMCAFMLWYSIWLIFNWGTLCLSTLHFICLWHLIDQIDLYPSVLSLPLYLYSSLKLI